MWKIAGLPAHILMNHFVVVLVPLTAILLIICAVWPAARQRLVWLVLVLATITLVVTPLTVKAGEWMADRVDETPDLDTHMNAGETAIYMAVVLFIAAVVLTGLHVVLQRGRMVQPVVRWTVVAVVILASGWTMYRIHTIGESGARAAWGTLLSSSGSQ